MNDLNRKTLRSAGFIDVGQHEKEIALCLYERHFTLISREEPGSDFSWEIALYGSMSETSEGLAFK